MTTNPTRPLKIFYCYARKDKTLLDQLEGHLEVMKRSGKITTWSDRDIKPGSHWEHDVNEQLNTSDIILLLITPNFLRSSRCDKEMSHVLERQQLGSAYVIPVILRPSGWKNTLLSDLQVLPSDGKPVTTWRNRDEAFENVAQGIHEIITILLSNGTKDQKQNYEKIYLKQIKNRFVEEANYFIPLSYEASELVNSLSDGAFASPSTQRQRGHVEVSYYEWIWIAKEQEIKRVKLKNLTEGIHKYPCIILLGDPGSGKTTSLKHLAFHLAEKPDKIPLFLRLGRFRTGMALEDFILDSWGGSLDADSWNAPELGANLRTYLEAGKLFFLFDGLNEMPQKDYIERTMNLRRFIDKWQQKGNQFVVSCRLLDYTEELSGLQRVEIRPLNDDQIRSFLMIDPFVKNWTELWQALTRSRNTQHCLLDIARNPYLLTVIIDIFNEDSKLGQKRAKLMARFVEILMSEAKKKCPPEIWLDADIQHEVLSILAFEMQDRSGFGTPVDTKLVKTIIPSAIKISPNWPPLPLSPEPLLNLVSSAKIIEMPVDRSSVRFYHQLLQEYFSAHQMLKRDIASLSEYWQCPWLETEMPAVSETSYQNPLPPPPPTKWEETTIMAAQLIPENDIQFIQALLRINPILAGRCLYEGQVTVDWPIYNLVIEQLLLTIANPSVALRVRIAAGNILGDLGDPRLRELVTVPSGIFLMGSDYGQDNEKPRHNVFLSTYQFGKYPVTNAEYRHFIEAGGYINNHWWTEEAWLWKDNRGEPGFWQDPWFNKPNQPVVGVTWYECVAYCRWLSAETGQLYRLPSELEWEKAARGIKGWQYPWGNKFELNRLNAMEGDFPVMMSTPVGIYPGGVSSFGAFDCSGNVWDWCSTSRNRDYPYSAQEDEWKTDYLQGSQGRVLRGGSWCSRKAFTRCATRVKFGPDFNNHHCGFRLATPESTPNENTRHYYLTNSPRRDEDIFVNADDEPALEDMQPVSPQRALDTFLNRYYNGELNFEGIDLSEQDLSGFNMISINFSNASLKRINLEGAFLEDAIFINANLSKANLRGAELSRANLTGANLEGADLEGTFFSNTIMPDGSVR